MLVPSMASFIKFYCRLVLVVATAVVFRWLPVLGKEGPPAAWGVIEWAFWTLIPGRNDVRRWVFLSVVELPVLALFVVVGNDVANPIAFVLVDGTILLFAAIAFNLLLRPLTPEEAIAKTLEDVYWNRWWRAYKILPQRGDATMQYRYRIRRKVT